MVTIILIILLLFIISWLISATIIFFATKILGQKQGFSTAMTTALIGTIIFTASYLLINNGFWSSLIGGVAWLFSLKKLYGVGWIKSAIIAIVIWLMNSITSTFLPVLF